MPPLHDGRPLAQPSSRDQQEAGHGSSRPGAQEALTGSGDAVGSPHQLPQGMFVKEAPVRRQDGHRQQYGSQTEAHSTEGDAASGSSVPSGAATSAAAVQPGRSRLSNGGGRSSRHAHFEDMAGLSSSHGAGANAVSAAAGAKSPGDGHADSSPVSNGSLASDLPLQSLPGSPPAPEIVAAAAATAAASVPPGFQASQQRSAHPPLPGWPQHRRPGQRRALSLGPRSGSGASPRLGLEALLGVEGSCYSGAGHMCQKSPLTVSDAASPGSLGSAPWHCIRLRGQGASRWRLTAAAAQP